MDQPDDLPIDGTPGEDGYDLGKNKQGPTLPSDEPMENELDEATPEELANAADEAADQLETALEGVEDTQDEDTNPDIENLPEFDPDMKADSEDVPVDTEVPTDSTDEPPDIEFDFAVAPASVDTASPPPTAAELVAISDALGDLGGDPEAEAQAFGEKLDAFNEAGGADGGGDSGFSGPESGDSGGPLGPLGQFADATVGNATTQYEFLMDHARALSDLQRRLENERL